MKAMEAASWATCSECGHDLGNARVWIPGRVMPEVMHMCLKERRATRIDHASPAAWEID